MPELVKSEQVRGPNDEVVKIRFYDDGSVRFQIDKATPVAIKEAYLLGVGKDVIVKLIPVATG